MTRDPAVTSRIMSHVRNRDTTPELMLRRELHRRGLRFRVNVRTLPGSPDVVFSRARVAVFVDGDFWHGAGWRKRGFTSFEEQFRNHRDPEKWVAKIRRNVERDIEVGEALSALGWRVIRVWESDVRSNAARSADDVERAVRSAPHSG